MFRDNIEIQNKKLPDSFACFFNNKVNNIVGSTNVENNVYNGVRRVEAEIKMFIPGLWEHCVQGNVVSLLFCFVLIVPFST